MYQTRTKLFSLAAVIVIGGGLILALLFALAGGLKAMPTATWYVDAVTGSDANNCQSPGTACATVKAAVGKASSADFIEIAAGTYAEYDITNNNKSLTLTGAGADSTFIDGGGNGRVFVLGNSVVISGVTIQNGRIITPSSILFDTAGGAMQVGTNAYVTLRNSRVISSSTVGNGGGIFNNGTLILENSDVLSNTADGLGGGIYNYTLGVITMTQGTVGNNTAVGIMGGGIYTNQPLYLINATIRDNSAGTFGGGLNVGDTTVLDGVTLTGNQSAAGAALFSQTGAISITNSTVSGNIADNNQAGLYVNGANVSLYLVNSTIANNIRINSISTGWNGIMLGGGATVTSLNTILANNDGNNCGGTNGSWNSLGYNLSTDFTCAFTQTGDQQGVDPLLGALADNGGDTLTHALQPGSPAIDAGTNAGCPATDQRGVARPYDGDNDATATCDIGSVEAQHQLTIADVSVLEGDVGASTAVFTVTLAPTHTQIVTVSYTTISGTAASGSDYTAVTGTLAFNPGDDTQIISIDVLGDLFDEPDEQFTVQLSNPTNAELLNDTATGTIVDDDGLPQLAIADQTVLEGNSGSVNALFDVTLSPASADVVTVDYTTNDGTAVAGSDYTAVSNTLTFQPGETGKTIAVQVTGDNVDEGGSESFTVDLSNAANAAIADSQGSGVITDDETARLSQTFGPQVLEGDSGLTPAVFTVTLSTPAAFTVTVDFNVSSGFGDTGAKAGEDFVPISGTLAYQPGETVQTYTVQIIGDTDLEADEVYSTLISNANIPITVNGGQGKILNDDDQKVYLPVILK